MVSDWSRKLALRSSGIKSYPGAQEEPEKQMEATSENHVDATVKRRRKRNQQDRYLTKRQAYNHPSLNKD